MLQFSSIGCTAALAACCALIPAFSLNAAALDEITVTARKTTENLQQVPLSIKAISAEEIDRLGLKDISNIANQDTSVQFDLGFSESDTKVVIRGLSPTRGRPNVATLIDGIDVSSEAVTNSGGSLLINPRMIDVESIEIIKGPQSALYGRSAFAGAIQYVTKDPEDEFGGGVFVDYNLEGDEEIRGNVSIPLSDTFGMRINGASWRKDGYYTNAATGEPLGDGDGSGIAVTFKWEPTDNFSAKWRTDYADDAFGPAPQALLNEFSTLYDLGNSGGLTGTDSEGRSVSNVAPITNACNPIPGPVGSYDCGPGQALDQYLRDVPGAGPSSSFIYGALGNTYPDGFGLYDVTDPWVRNIYNKQVIQTFSGRIPDGKFLAPSLMPDYRKSANPLDAKDFEGSTRRVFRNSLTMDWDINESVALSSYTGFTDAEATSQMDLGKFYVDKCRPGADQAGNIPELRQQNDCTAGDGIHDGGTTFMADNIITTKQFSQEFRVAWDVSEDLSFTQGIQYWRERVEQESYTQITVTADAFCFLSYGNPFLGTPYDFAFGPLGSNFQCGITTVPAAYFASKTYETVNPPIVYERDTDHYSWYGNIQWDVTDKFRTTFEARFTREDSSVAGPTMNVCLNGLSQDYLNNPDDPDNGIISPFRDAYTGYALCEGYLTNPLDGGAFWNAPNQTNAPATSLIVDPNSPDWTGGPMSGRIDGPTSYIICGFTGRCDMLESAPGGSPGNPGSYNAFGYDRANYTTQRLNKTDRYWAPKATFEYFWSDDIMTYFSWSRGIKPGGFNLVTAGQFGLDGSGDGVYDEIDFTEERLDVWELGAKTTTMNGRLRVNGALFFQDFKDKQIGVQEIIGSVVGTRIRNISGSEVKGLELDASFQVTDNLVISGGYTYLDSEYTDYTTISESPNDIARVQLGNGQGCLEVNEVPAGSGDPFCTLSYNGNELERSPKHAFLVNANYTNSLLDTGLEWFGMINYSWQDMRWLESFNIVELPSYSRTNVSAGIVGDNWDVQFYINNVFDDDTITSAGGNPGLPRAQWRLGLADGAVAGPKIPNDVFVNMPIPRIFGARVNWRFGG
jgi:outer membrane receptor protein involved in Fe transport